MGFHTTLHLYRPFPATRVSYGEIVTFARAVAATDVLHYVHMSGAVQPGSRYVERVAYRLCRLAGGEPWDRDCDFGIYNHLPQDAFELLPPEREICRAYLTVGALARDVSHELSRIASPENGLDFTPDTLGVHVGMIELYGIQDDLPCVVGGLSISISGGGYLFPWTPREALERIHSCDAMREVARIANDIWPFVPRLATSRDLARRRRLGRLWMDDVDRPVGWTWGPAEG